MTTARRAMTTTMMATARWATTTTTTGDEDNDGDGDGAMGSVLMLKRSYAIIK
jgi:hypothetical protein